MIISVGKSRRDTKWRSQEVSWSELCARLGSVERTRETMREYRAMSRDEQGAAKDIGGFVGGRLNGMRRCREAMADRCLVTLDADNAQPDTWDDVLVSWEEGAMCCYSTHSSTPEKPRLRFVIPLKRAVTPEEYPAVARKLAQKIGIDIMDSSTYDVCRLMYWPSCPMDGVPFFGVLEGEPVDPDRVLREYGLGEAWKDTTLWPIGKGEQEVVRRESRRQGDPREKPGMVGLFCRTYDIPAAVNAFLPDLYEEAGEERYTYRPGSTAGGAVLYDGGLFLYSHHGTDPCGGQLVNAFDLVRIQKFRELDAGKEGTETTKLPSYRKMCEFAAGLDAVKKQAVKEQMDGLHDLLDCEDKEDDGLDWSTRLTRDAKTGAVEQTMENAKTILEHAPGLRGVLAYDLMLDAPVLRGDVPWRMVDTAKSWSCRWSDADMADLYLYMEAGFGFDQTKKIDIAFKSVTRRHSFHPVREYLESLVWDGTDRLDTMLVRWMGAEDTPFVRAATRKWMCGAVARVLQPGCKFDNMLVLTGAQGIGKSELGRQLSRGWFSDSISRMDNSKESMEAVKGSWIIEVAELAAMRKGEQEGLKNYLTKQQDKMRGAYKEFVTETPRCCVFYGTTNDKTFLRDHTGNRRFWPVEVRGVGHGEKLKNELGAEVDQLWAEAVARYHAGEVLWMDGKLAELAAQAQDEHIEVGEYEIDRELIVEYLNTPVPEDWDSRDKYQKRAYFEQASGTEDLGRQTTGTVLRQKILLREIAWELFGEAQTRARTNVTKRINDVMASLPAWERARYNAGWGWRREQES